MLGFTLATGEPLCCAIIYCSQVEDVDVAVRMGIQPWCEINGEGVTDLEANSNGLKNSTPLDLPVCTMVRKSLALLAAAKTEATHQVYLPQCLHLLTKMQSLTERKPP
jgi:hypothetical protein